MITPGKGQVLEKSCLASTLITSSTILSTVYIYQFLTFRGLNEFGVLQAVTLLDGKDECFPEFLDDG